MQLNNLSLNQFASVININCSPVLTQRFQDLGLVPGTQISPVFKAPFGDPTAYEFRGNIIAIRKDEASKIIVKPIQL